MKKKLGGGNHLEKVFTPNDSISTVLFKENRQNKVYSKKATLIESIDKR
jgi:hypothetical protein